jgi:hypothetical protein
MATPVVPNQFAVGKNRIIHKPSRHGRGQSGGIPLHQKLFNSHIARNKEKAYAWQISPNHPGNLG